MSGADTLIAEATARLTAAGIADARQDAVLLFCHTAGLGREDLLRDPAQAASADIERRFADAVARRASREPMSHITGEREFWSLPFFVDRRVLDPRPDSETLVEAVLADFSDRQAPLRLLDLGTGTGCLLCALLTEFPAATGVGVDVSDAALRVARANAGRHGLAARARLQFGNWARDLAGPFDVIVANPPYIVRDDMASLKPEVRCHEPVMALDGGTDGLDAYRAICPDLPRLLAHGGGSYLEVGMGQAGMICDLMREAGMTEIGVRRDLAGIDRVVTARGPVSG